MFLLFRRPSSFYCTFHGLRFSHSCVSSHSLCAPFIGRISFSVLLPLIPLILAVFLYSDFRHVAIFVCRCVSYMRFSFSMYYDHFSFFFFRSFISFLFPFDPSSHIFGSVHFGIQLPLELYLLSIVYLVVFPLSPFLFPGVSCPCLVRSVLFSHVHSALLPLLALSFLAVQSRSTVCSTAYSSSRGFLPILWVFSLRQTNGPHVNINLYHPNGHICLVPIHLSLPFFTSPSRVPIPCQPCLPASAALTLPTSMPCGNNSTSFTPIKHPTGFAIFNHCHHTRRGSPSISAVHVTLAFIQYPRS